jgi:hypothetical protein
MPTPYILTPEAIPANWNCPDDWPQVLLRPYADDLFTEPGTIPVNDYFRLLWIRQIGFKANIFCFYTPFPDSKQDVLFHFSMN